MGNKNSAAKARKTEALPDALPKAARSSSPVLSRPIKRSDVVSLIRAVADLPSSSESCMAALQTLCDYSEVKANRDALRAMGSLEDELVIALIDAVPFSVGDAKEKALTVVKNLAYEPRPLWSIPSLLFVLKGVALYDEGESRAITLEILMLISVSDENRLPMGSARLELIAALKVVVLQVTGTAQLHLLHTLENLFEKQENIVQISFCDWVPMLNQVISTSTGAARLSAQRLLFSIPDGCSTAPNSICPDQPHFADLLLALSVESETSRRHDILNMLTNMSTTLENTVILSSQLNILGDAISADDRHATMLGILRCLSVNPSVDKVELLAVLKKAVSKDCGESTVAALEMLHKLVSSDERSSVALASHEFEMLPLLRIIIVEQGCAWGLALRIVYILSLNVQNKGLISSPSAGLLPVLQTVVAHDVNTDLRMTAIGTLLNLSGTFHSRETMLSADDALTPILIHIVADNDGEAMIRALQNVMSCSMGFPGVKFDIKLAVVLIHFLAVGSAVTQVLSLNMLLNMDRSDHIKFSLAVAELGLLRVLKDIIETDSGQCSQLALRALLSISNVAKVQILMGADYGLLLALRNLVADGTGECKINALRVFSELAAHSSNQIFLGSQVFGLVHLLITFVSTNSGPARDVALSILIIVLTTNKNALLPILPALLPVLRSICCGGSAVAKSWALVVLADISTSTEFAVAICSPELGLLQILFDMVHVGSVAISALEVLRNLSAVRANRPMMTLLAPSQMTMVHKLLAGTNAQATLFVLQILFNLLLPSDCANVVMISSDLLCVLMQVVTSSCCGDVVELSLKLLHELQTGIAELELLHVLEKILTSEVLFNNDERCQDAKVHALRMLQCVADNTNDIDLFASHVCANIEILLVLKRFITEPGDGALFALRTLHVLSKSIQCNACLVSPNLALLPVLKKLAIETNGETNVVALHTLIILVPVDQQPITLQASDISLLHYLKDIILSESEDTIILHALRTVASFSSATNNAELLSPDLHLMDVLLKFLTGSDSDTLLLSLTILNNLSSYGENRTSIQFASENLFNALKVAIQQDGKVALCALHIVHNLSLATTSHVVVSNLVAEFIEVLTKVAAHGINECSLVALSIMANLTADRSNVESLGAPDLELLLALKNTVTTDGQDKVLRTLQVLNNLSASPLFASAFVDVGLLMFLKNIVAGRDGESCISTLGIFLNMSKFTEVCIQMVSLDLQLLPALKRALLTCVGSQQMLVLCLSILQAFSNITECCNALVCADLDLLPLLVGVIVRGRGEAAARSLFILQRLFNEHVDHDTVLRSLSGIAVATMIQHDYWDVDLETNLREQATVMAHQLRRRLKVAEMSATIQAEHGVPLELYLSCTQYRRCILDEKLRQLGAKGGRLVVSAINEVRKELSRVISEMNAALELDIFPPSDFQAVGNDCARQASWLAKHLDSFSDYLIKNSMYDQLVVFDVFLNTLPLELHNAGQSVEVSQNDVKSEIAYAEIVDDVVNLDIEDGRAVIVNGVYHSDHGHVTIPVKIKLRSGTHAAVMIQHEFRLMETLHRHASTAVVVPFMQVEVSNRTLRKCVKTIITSGELSAFVGIVLEKGNMSMDVFLTTSEAREPVRRTDMLVGAVRILEEAHRHQIALMDFKPANMVFCVSHNVTMGTWKAIDFDNSRHFGEVVAKAATPEYASYEMARYLLFDDTAPLKADPAMDVCSLGWTIWVIYNNGVSLWDILGFTSKSNSSISAEEQDHRILAKLATMTQSELLQHINGTFADDSSTHSALRRLLPKLLHVDPRLRLPANQLKAESSLFGVTNPTVLRTIKGIHDKLDEISEELRLSLSKLSGQLNETLLASIKDNHAIGTVTALEAFVKTLELQREEDRLSMAHIKSAMECLPTAMASSLLPSINAILADQHDQSMTALDKLDDVTAMMKDMKLQLDEVLSLQRTQLSILKQLKHMGYNNFPSTFVIIPQRPSGTRQGKGLRKAVASVAKAVYDSLADTLFSTLYLFFFCPVTGKLTQCGIEGNGYVLKTMKKWVRELVPLVKMGLLMAKVVLATQGLGALVPCFPSMGDHQQLDDMLSGMIDTVDSAASYLNTQAPMQSLEDCVVGALSEDMMRSILDAVAQQDGETGCRDYRPRRMGLETTTCLATGDVAWVSADGKAAFERDGPAAFTRVK